MGSTVVKDCDVSKPLVPKQRTSAEAPQERLLASGELTESITEALAKRRSVHFRGAAPQLIGQLDIDSVIAALVHGSEAGNASAFKNGEPCMRGSLFLAYLDQATLTLSTAERLLTPLLKICEGLGRAFHYVSARLVMDPPMLRIPPLQVDGDFLAVQIWGHQRLKVCQPVTSLPVSARRPEPLLVTTVAPGDAIVVPAGHEVRFEGPGDAADGRPMETEPSLYVVFFLRTQDKSLGTSLGRHLTDVLREEGKFSNEADAFFRKAVTKRTLLRSPVNRASLNAEEAEAMAAQQRAELKALLQKSVAELSKQVNGASLRKHFTERMEQQRKEQGEAAAKVLTSGMPSLPPNSVTTRSFIRVAQGVTCRCEPGAVQAFFKRGSETLPLPIAKSASYLISELSDGKPRSIASLPCSDPVERLCVCQILVFKECFEVLPEERNFQGEFS